MRHIRQAKLFDCGVAVAAMVGGVPYKAALDRLVIGLSSETALNPLVMWRTLQDVTQKEWQMKELRPPWPLVRDYSISDSATALLMQRTDSSRHYIAVIGHSIHDPLFDSPIAQEEYPDGNSAVITVFEAKLPPVGLKDIRTPFV